MNIGVLDIMPGVMMRDEPTKLKMILTKSQTEALNILREHIYVEGGVRNVMLPPQINTNTAKSLVNKGLAKVYDHTFHPNLFSPTNLQRFDRLRKEQND